DNVLLERGGAVTIPALFGAGGPPTAVGRLALVIHGRAGPLLTRGPERLDLRVHRPGRLARRAAARRDEPEENEPRAHHDRDAHGFYFASARLVRAIHAHATAFRPHQTMSAARPKGPVASPSIATDAR